MTPHQGVAFLDFPAPATVQLSRLSASCSKERAFRMPETNVFRAPSPRSACSERLRCLLKRLAIVLLLLAIPALSTLAKKSWYLPQADTAHYLNGAIKMKVSHARLLADREPPLPIAQLVPPPVQTRTIERAQPKPSVPSIRITAFPQYRPPPFCAGSSTARTRRCPLASSLFRSLVLSGIAGRAWAHWLAFGNGVSRFARRSIYEEDGWPFSGGDGALAPAQQFGPGQLDRKVWRAPAEHGLRRLDDSIHF